jgi:probable F420-dependent oxidoreductase
MRFCVQLPTERADAPDEFLTAAAIGEMARAAEAAGFDACFVTDHPIPDDAWLASGGHHTLDPFVALAFAAAATERLRLQTHVLVLPYRNPFLVAKSAVSLDVASGGRATLGVAAGYLEGEFAALGVPFDERNDLTDEAISVIRRAWSESGVVHEGRHFHAAGNTALPRPVQQPGPPIWVGGNSRRAIRRAVELCDGWLPFPAGRGLASRIRTAAIRTPEDLAERMDYMRSHAEAVGRTAPLDVGFAPFASALRPDGSLEVEPALEQARSFAKLGVTWLMLNVPSATRAEYLERVAELGDGLVRPLRASG